MLRWKPPPRSIKYWRPTVPPRSRRARASIFYLREAPALDPIFFPFCFAVSSYIMDPSSETTPDCLTCGQHHATTEPHVYDYASDVDDDLTCHICLQPFVEPTDLPCGHTLCGACLSSYLRLHAACPIDRLPLVPARCGASSLVLRR